MHSMNYLLAILFMFRGINDRHEWACMHVRGKQTYHLEDASIYLAI